MDGGRYIRIRWILLLAGLLVIWLIRGNPGWGERYARSVYPIVSGLLSRFSGLFSFSIGDVFIYGSIVGLLLYGVVSLFRRRGIGRTLRPMAEYLLWIYVWFYLAWGLNYFREDFYMRTGIERVRFSSERFEAFLKAYTDSLNAAWIPVEDPEPERIRQAIGDGYRRLSSAFGLIRPADYLRPKMMLFSRLMSGVGVSGYIGPFFIEYHLNGQMPPVQYAATYAHELAHVLGVSSEAEANLYSYLVCTSSTAPEIRFSGYFALLPYVIRNARVGLEKEAYEAWLAGLRPEIKELYSEKIAYWRALYSPWIGEAQDKIYNFFLKGNKISSGTANYAEVIALLIAWEDSV